MVTIHLSRKGIEELAVLVYEEELKAESTEKERKHYEGLIRGRAVNHLREKGFKVKYEYNPDPYREYEVTII